MIAGTAETAGGIGLVALALLDIFRTVLYARLGKGILSKWLARSLWRLMDGVARHSATLRKRVLPLAGPLILVAVIATWSLLLVTGFALVIHPALGDGITATSGPSPTDFVTACYVAGDSMTTIGTSDLAPRKPFYRVVYLFASLVGISVITLTITYLLEVYNALQGHNTFGLKLHMASAESGLAVEWIARLGTQERFDIGFTMIGEIAGELAQLKESVHFYPVSLYFHFPGDHYALPRQLLLVLDAEALCQTALDRESHAWLQESASLQILKATAEALLKTLCKEFITAPRQEPAGPGAEALWRHHFRHALERLAKAGIKTAADHRLAAERYMERRREWQPPIDALARHLDYRPEEVDVRVRESLTQAGGGPAHHGAAVAAHLHT